MDRSGRLLMLICLFGLSTAFAQSNNSVIYGEDDRVDVINSTNSLHVELALSTAAMINTSSLISKDDGQVEISAGSFQDRINVCSDERFAAQQSAANCSGFLVGDDLLVTAGHCMRKESDCQRKSWVFDYRISHEGQTEHTVNSSSVYQCAEIIDSVVGGNRDDYALIRLDRVVTDRLPLRYRRDGEVIEGDSLVVIGHPSGIPTKIADGAEVKSTNDIYFQANLDTYGGNSGSAVFNSITGIVEGILVRGMTDYVFENGCRVSNLLGNDNGSYEEVTKITNIPALMSL